MRAELEAAIHRNPARTAVMVVGVGAVAASRWLPASGWVVVLGLFMVTLAGLLPWLEELAFGRDGLRARTRPNLDAVDSTRMVEETSKELAAGQTPDLDQAEVAQFPAVYAANAALRSILSSPKSSVPLPGVSLHLYMFDEQENVLAPVFEHEPDPLNAWPPGIGAVGKCFESLSAVVYIEGMSDLAQFGLTREQHDRYGARSAVLAVPVVNRAGELMAVLAASTSSPDPLPTDDAVEEALDWASLLASSIARIFVDLLRWYADTPLDENG